MRIIINKRCCSRLDTKPNTFSAGFVIDVPACAMLQRSHWPDVYQVDLIRQFGIIESPADRKHP